MHEAAPDDDLRYIPLNGAMYSLRHSKADLATNVAIRVMAEGGWQALTLRRMADSSNVTPQAVAAWFPSVARMRTAVAHRYGDRWIGALGDRIRWWLNGRLPPGTVISAADVAVAALPRTWLEVTFDRIWLTIVEAGQWDETVAEAVSETSVREWQLFADLLVTKAGHDSRDAEAVAQVGLVTDVLVTLVRGMRAARCATGDPMSAERAEVILRAGLPSGAR